MPWLSSIVIKKSFYGLVHADYIITDSYFTQKQLIKYLPQVASKTTVVHAGVDEQLLDYSESEETARQTLEDQLQIQLTSPLLLYVGSEIPRKNIYLLLQILKELKKDYPTIQLLKIGTAGGHRWRTETLRYCSELELVVGKDILILEHINDQMLAHAYRTANVYVSTSLYEGFGLPALEALAVGTPVVVAARGASPEIVGPVGIVIEPTITEFVQSIHNVLAETSNEIIRNYRKQYASLFTWQQAANRYLKVNV